MDAEKTLAMISQLREKYNEQLKMLDELEASIKLIAQIGKDKTDMVTKWGYDWSLDKPKPGLLQKTKQAVWNYVVLNNGERIHLNPPIPIPNKVRKG